MIVILKDNIQKPFGKQHKLTARKHYTVIGIEANYYRILDDTKDPVLFSPNLFNLIDETIPRNWITWFGEEGEKYSYPPELKEIGFFEDFHEGKQKAIKAFNKFLEDNPL